MRVDPATTRTLHHPDPVIQEVLDIWAARFLAGHIALGDLTATVGRIGDWSDWAPEWMATARIHEAMGEAAWDEGRRVTAVDSFLAASRCYHLSYFLSVDDLETHAQGLAKMVECHDRVLPYMAPPVEKVTIPFPDADLTGLVSIPRSNIPGIRGPAPLVILLAWARLDQGESSRRSGKSAPPRSRRAQPRRAGSGRDQHQAAHPPRLRGRCRRSHRCHGAERRHRHREGGSHRGEPRWLLRLSGGCLRAAGHRRRRQLWAI